MHANGAPDKQTRSDAIAIANTDIKDSAKSSRPSTRERGKEDSNKEVKKKITVNGEAKTPPYKININPEIVKP